MNPNLSWEQFSRLTEPLEAFHDSARDTLRTRNGGSHRGKPQRLITYPDMGIVARAQSRN